MTLARQALPNNYISCFIAFWGCMCVVRADLVTLINLFIHGL